ncbi:hypothetical protein DRW41_12770 [Neobacillus piezotolerans]|uniref:Uncharacterized protein n=1 Tax=Neobacillus piezotolerans TaxID=2259171 RepID=A0A3D8GQ46_9BACI|nr:hypothetical protein DRW41_12770 [Neobacillus piezotolerans]
MKKLGRLAKWTNEQSRSKKNKLLIKCERMRGKMEKYYCEKCRLLYNKKTACKVCGMLASNKIWIEVQKQNKD